jgi:hypothetical protein
VRDVAAGSDSWSRQRGENLTQSLMGGAGGESAADDSVIAPGVRPGLGAGNAAGGRNEGDGGALAPFGVPGGGSGQGPRANFMGVSGNARRIVYIVDASGSMMTIFPHVRFKLNESIGILRPSQAFNVFVFSNATVTAFNKGGLLTASPENKRKAVGFGEGVIAAGTTNPLPAIREAFTNKPELIYVLTDGFDVSEVPFAEIAAEFRKANADKRVRVNTILIRSRDDKELEKILDQIAKENGGVFKILERTDF